MNLGNSDETKDTNVIETSLTAIEVPARTKTHIPPLIQDYLDRKADELAIAKQRFANACYYAMLSEGLTWYEFFLPVTGRLNYSESGEVAKAFDRLIEAISDRGIPNLAEDFHESAEEED